MERINEGFIEAIKKATNPQELEELIERYLDCTVNESRYYFGGTSLAIDPVVYPVALDSAIRFWKENPTLPVLDPQKGSDLLNLQSLRLWCINASQEIEGRNKGSRRETCKHSKDYSTVVWYNETYNFNPTQSKCIERLWQEWAEDPRLAVRETTIGTLIGSENKDFRLRHVFRNTDGTQNAAWGTMVQKTPQGTYQLGKPRAKRSKNKKQNDPKLSASS